MPHRCCCLAGCWFWYCWCCWCCCRCCCWCCRDGQDATVATNTGYLVTVTIWGWHRQRGAALRPRRHGTRPRRSAPPRSSRTRESRTGRGGHRTQDTEDRAHCTSPPGGRRTGTGLVQRRVGLGVSFVGRRIIRRPGAAPGVGAAGALLSPEGVAGSRRPPRRDTPAKTGYRLGQGHPAGRAAAAVTGRRVAAWQTQAATAAAGRAAVLRRGQSTSPVVSPPPAGSASGKPRGTGGSAASRCSPLRLIPLSPRAAPPAAASSSLLRPALNHLRGRAAPPPEEIFQ